MGWVAYLLGLAGLGLLWRRGRAAQAVALIPGVMVLANGALKAAQERYILVAMPVLFIAAALAAIEAGRWLASRAAWQRAAVLAPAILALTAAAWPLPEYIGLGRALALPIPGTSCGDGSSRTSRPPPRWRSSSTAPSSAPTSGRS